MLITNNTEFATQAKLLRNYGQDLRKLHLYDAIKNLCDVLLHVINGGTVVNVIAVKHS